MSAETRKVLEMLAAGKITCEDAERLLDKLAAAKTAEEGGEHSGNAKDRPATLKFLHVLVGGEGRDVNVKVPLSFLRAGVRLLGVLPPRVAQNLADQGINLEFLSELRGEELDQALNALHVDVETDDGHHVQVFCE